MSTKQRNESLLDGRPEKALRQVMDHMDQLIDDVLVWLSDPKKETLGDVVLDGFPRKNPMLAIALRLIQLASNLRAAQLLIEQGFVFELGIMRRVLYETHEDVSFLLSRGLLGGQDELHQQFITAFYATDQEAAKPVRRHKIREQLKEIQIQRRSLERGVPSVEKVMGGLYRSNSRYIHGRASNILRMYDVEENRFRTAGVNEEGFFGDEWNSFWLVSYSVMMCFAAVQARFRYVNWRSDMRALAESFWEIAELQNVSVHG